MKEELNQPFAEEEVTTTLAQMCPTKAVGPNEKPRKVAEFRSISLYNVIYRIVAKNNS